jgi:hypothetical protein
MIYLIVGLDRTSFAPWHQNVMAADVAEAVRDARTRASKQGIDLVVAAVIGMYSSVLEQPVGDIVAQRAA